MYTQGCHGVEHGEVVRIVLEGQPQVEAEVPELVDGVPLVPVTWE